MSVLIMQYLFSLDVENDIRNLIEGLPKFKSEKSEVSPNCEITKITDSSQMVIQLFIKGDSLSLAKYMDNLHTLLINTVDSSPTILINESSARFNKELYPLVNTFERKLRTMIYLKNVGNDDLIVDKLETLTFEKLYEILFTDNIYG